MGTTVLEAGQRHKRGRLSDEELLKYDFTTSDPESIPNLSDTLPANFKDAAIARRYDVTPPKGTDRPRIWCAHCRGHRHWRGYVMLTEDGIAFLIGKDCGAGVLGYKWTDIERQFTDDMQRARYLRRYGPTQAALPGAMRDIAKLLDASALAQFDRLRSRMGWSSGTLDPRLKAQRVEAPDFRALYDELAKARRRDGRLIIETRVRDHLAEERRADRYKQREVDLRADKSITATERSRQTRTLRDQRKSDRDAIHKTVEEVAGRSTALQFLALSCTPRQTLQVSLHRLVRAEQSLPHSAIGKETRELREMFRHLRAITDEIDAQLDYLKLPLRFFDRAHLKFVADWATRQPACGGRYRATDAGLIYEHAEGDILLSLPTGYTVPILPELETLKAAMDLSGSA